MACQPYLDTQNHGGKEYAEAVFAKMMEMNINLAGIYDSKRNINNSFLDYCRQHGGLLDVNDITLQQAVDSEKYNVFYSALPYCYDGIRWGSVKFIGNLHGLRPLEAFTDEYEYKYSVNLKGRIKAWIKGLGIVERWAKKNFFNTISKILDNPSFVCVTGSEHSKFALLNYFPQIEAKNIAVFYDPLNLEKVVEEKDEDTEKYYLLVSGNRWLKNTYRGVKALDQLISTGLICSKVIVTGTSPNMLYLKEIKNKECFVFKNYVSASELASLYKNAYCLIFLSLSEGFGYPPLEAISRGTPVICSPLTALYEVYQNGVLYCDPLSIEDIKVKILEMEDEIIRERYVRNGVTHGKKMIEFQKKELSRLVDFIMSFV